MSKIKKVLAVFLTLAMVLGMGMTTFAAGGINISNAEKATLQISQVIKADNTKVTGWAFTEYGAAAYREAYGVPTNDDSKDQAIIAGLIIYADSKAVVDKSVEPIEATAALIESALAKVTNGFEDYKNGDPITVPGVYAIKAAEDGYAYSPMAAYIAFGANTTTNLNAKKAPTEVDKYAKDEITDKEDADKVTEIGRTVTYKVESTVPYIEASAINPYYVFTDTLTGATYNVITDENSENYGKLPVNVSIASGEPTTYYATVTGNTFVLDLSTLLKDNENANFKIQLSYDVTVIDVQVGNTIKVGDSLNEPNDKYGKDNENLFTATIQLVKYASDDDNENLDDNEKLADAEFIVSKTENKVTYYAVAVDGKLTGWTKEEKDATHLKTDKEGKISLQGLNVGTYSFIEKVAPEGYSVNSEAKTVEVKEDGTATAVITVAPVSMIDTKLSALPSTGGIGTTIFTIGGCLIMIIAAALFFASRRKENK